MEFLKEHISSKTLIFINKILNQILELEKEEIKFARADIYNLLFNVSEFLRKYYICKNANFIIMVYTS